MNGYTGRIAIRFVVFFLITIFCILAIHVLRQNILQNAQHVGTVMASNYASEVRRNLQTVENQINFAVNMLSRLQPETDEQELVERTNRFMTQAREVMEGRVRIYLIRDDGRLIATAGGPDEIPVEYLDPADTPWYARALAAGDALCYTDAYADRLNGRPVITISRKFPNSNYVLAYDVFPDTFNFYFDDDLLTARESFFFTDSIGCLLYAITGLKKTDSELRAYVRWLVRGIEAGDFAAYDDFITDLDGRARAVYYTRLPNGWYSIVTVPHANIISGLSVLNGILTVGMVLFLGGILFFSWREMHARKLMERSIETVRVLGNHYVAIYRMYPLTGGKKCIGQYF